MSSWTSEDLRFAFNGIGTFVTEDDVQFFQAGDECVGECKFSAFFPFFKITFSFFVIFCCCFLFFVWSESLIDLQRALQKDDPETHSVQYQIMEWNILAERLLPLISSTAALPRLQSVCS
jgi:hypothetical protein